MATNVNYEFRGINFDQIDGTYELVIGISRDEFRKLPGAIKEFLRGRLGIADVEVIRENKRNPMIKTDDSGIYLNWSNGGAVIDLELADADVGERIEHWMIDNSTNDWRNEDKDRDNNGGPTAQEGKEKSRELREENELEDRMRRIEEGYGGSRAKEGQVYKPFGHQDAEYREKDHSQFDPSHPRCRDCAHWDDHGNCHIVPDVEPDGYCEEYFADVGVFGHEHEDFVEENLILIGEKFNWSIESVKDFVSDVKERLRNI